MGLTDNQKNLIRAIADNNISSAKKWALACCNEDETYKNSIFVSQYKSILSQPEKKLFELPQNVSGFMCAENVSETFNVRRYYLSERERELSEKITRMATVAAKLKEMKIEYRNSTLLFGESGTGKTTFGRYMAYKFDLPFCYIKFSTLVDSLIGGTSKNIAKAFSFAKSNPCVFMMDELDAVCTNRSDSGSSAAEEMNRVTITIMQELDQLPNDVVLLAATNRIDTIDDAVLRRFSIKHEVKPFDECEKERLLKKFLVDVGVTFSKSEIEKIISESGNQSGIINRAVEKIAEDILSTIDDDEERDENA